MLRAGGRLCLFADRSIYKEHDMSRWWMRVKETKEPFIVTCRTGYSSFHGKYGLGYRDRGRIISALRSSMDLIHRGMTFQQLEFVNQNGYTMDQMKEWPIEEGFALIHVTDKWYWSQFMTGRVWYKRASDIERQWHRTEWTIAIEEKRKPRKSPRVAKLVLVRSTDGKTVKEMPNWFC